MCLLYYKFHKVIFKRGGSYIDSPDWIKKKKALTNSKKDDDRCFQYAATIALNFDEIKKDTQRVWIIKSFINNYNWEGINYLSEIEDWNRSEKSNPANVLSMFFILKKKKYALLVFQKLIQIVKNK